MTNFKISIALAPLSLAACILGYDYRDDADDCVNQQGNQWCKEKHGQELYCRRGFSECGRSSEDGCELQPPTDPACYSPCGRMLSLSDVQLTCEGYDGSTSTSVASTTLGETTTTSGDASTSSGSTSGVAESGSSGGTESGSTGGPVGCLEHTDCLELGTPACGMEGLCVACDAVEDGDVACATLSGATPLCREGSCVACDDSNAGACPAETPACEDFACVECTADDTVACSVEHPVCFENSCVACTPDDIGACANNAAAPVCFEHACVA